MSTWPLRIQPPISNPVHVPGRLIDKVPDPPEEEDEDDEALDATVKVWLQEDKDDELTNGYDATRGGRLPPEK
jgi:hypothetical protein